MNDVGDIIYSDMDFYKNGPTCWTVTGPIKPGETKTFSGYGFYNQSFNGKYYIDKFIITYMDETVQCISNENFELYTDNLNK